MSENSENETKNLGASATGNDNKTLDPQQNAGSQGRTRSQKLLALLINGLLVIIIGIAVLLVWDRIQEKNASSLSEISSESTENEESLSTVDTETGSAAKVNLSPYATANPYSGDSGVTRSIEIHTTIPTRPRVDVITYTVEKDDTLFSIADSYGLKPETLLWGNFDTLESNPHWLVPDQELRILPVDGAYYEWSEGDSLTSVAEFFEVEPQDILEYPGNRFDLTVANVDNPGLEPGDPLIVPGGKRKVVDWGPPQISRNDPASAAYYGPGHCGSIYTGAVGSGVFVWPTDYQYITYNYNSVIHRALDLGGAIGDNIYASDAGVVVYAGWSNWGYGNLIVLDHGNGWQTAYAHMSSLSVGCGQSVFQGTVIGAMGSTGNSTGPHLHFETVFNGAKPNPLNVLP